SLERLVEHWLRAHEVLMEDAPHIRKLHVIHYEDLVENPRAELQKVSRFLSLEGEIPTQPLDRRRTNAYALRWEELSSSRVPWRSRVAQRLRDRYSSRVLELGCSLEELSSTAASRWPYDGTEWSKDAPCR